MKKVGILTFHYVDNYGAVLQAWALNKVINSFPDFCAEIINYVPKDYLIMPYSRTVNGIRLMQKKRKLFEEFLTREQMVTKPILNTVSGNEYDCYIAGSDQVWNLSFRENVTKEYLFPNLEKQAKRISYAASTGERITNQDKVIFQEYLKKFSAISVREEECAKQLYDLGFKDVQIVVDPTLLLNSADYESLIEEPENRPEKFLFFFTYMNGYQVSRWIPFINTMARNNNLDVIHTAINTPKEAFVSKKESVLYSSIGEFLWYMKHATVVVTTSYHGTIFGRLFERPTYIIHNDIGWGRMEQLNKVFRLEGRIVEEDWQKEDWDIKKCNVDDKLSIWKEQSIDFLRRELSRGEFE